MNIKKGMKKYLFFFGLFFFVSFVSAQSYSFNPDSISCPNDCTEINGHFLPKIVSDLPTDDLNEYLSNSSFTLGTDFFGGMDTNEDFLGDWWNYQPASDKVNELIEGKNTQYLKAESILRWVKSSKGYCSEELESNGTCASNANNRESYAIIFDSKYGVCLDGSFVAVTMLRKAGIPATMMHIGFNHIDVLLNADNNWYIYDPTPCADRSLIGDDGVKVCVDSEKLIQLGGDRILAWYHDAKASEVSSNGLYCDMSGACYDAMRFAWTRERFFGNNLTEVFIPNKNHFEYIREGTDSSGNQLINYQCTFYAGDLICDDYGCGYFDGVSNSVGEINKLKILGINGKSFSDTNFNNQYGYVYSRIPSNKFYKYECTYSSEEEPISINYFYSQNGSKIILTPESLEKASGASEELFNGLKSQMEESVKDININDYTSFINLDLSFEEGWNLVYGFYSPSLLTGGDIKSSDIKAIYTLNPETQDYILLYPSDSSENNINPYVNYASFWVYSDKSGIANYKAQEPLQISDVNLFKGWNFISVTPEFKGKSFNELKGEFNVSEVYAFADGSWYTLEGMLNDKDLFNNENAQFQGLAVKLPKSGNIGQSQILNNSSNSIPTLPNGEQKCTDSDGGNNIYIKGTISGISLTNELVTQTDYCEGNTLIEFFCNDETNNITPLNRINNNGVSCPTGHTCSDGACVKQ